MTPLKMAADLAQMSEIVSSMMRWREEYVLLYGREAALAAGFARKTQRVPRRLHQADHLPRSLAKTAAPALPEGEFHRPLEHPTILARIEPCRTRLEKALADVLAEKRAAETTLIAKRAAMQRHEEELSVTAGLFKNLLRLVGMDKEAALVRPFAQLREIRRRARRVEARRVEVAPAVTEAATSVDTASRSETAPSAQAVPAVGRELPVGREPTCIEAPAEHAAPLVRGGRRRFYRTLRGLARRVMPRAPPAPI